MNEKLLIAVVDGQGGGIGKQIVENLSISLDNYKDLINIRALGTNALATSNMLKAGANDGATGENAIMHNCKKADIIVGVLGIVIPDSILGELTANMATAINDSNASKILIPIHKCNINLAIPVELTLAQCIESAISLVLKTCKEKGVNINE